MEPLFQIGGLASGLDTQNIIDQLINIERVPIRRLERRQDDLRTVDDAWGTIASKLSGLRTALDDVRHATDWQGMATATSSNESAVGVTVTGSNVDVSSTSFTVQSLATRHRTAMSGTFADPTDLVGAGTFTITDGSGGTLATITTDASTTLAQLAADIDNAGVGVNAQVVNVDGTNHQLVLTADDTGAAHQFDASTDIAALGTSAVLETGADAHLTMGTLDIYRSSNSIDDLVEGVTLDLKATTTSDVTVSTARDVDGAVESVKALVDAANALLTELGKATAYNSESDTAGALQGDPTARRLALNVRSAISGVIDGLSGQYSYAGSVGISLTRDGGIELDEAALRQALTDDFDAVAGVFSQHLDTGGDTRVSFLRAAQGTTSGSYDVVIDTAASVAAATGATYSPPSGSPKTFTITADDGTPVSVTIEDGMTAQQAITQINNALAAAGQTSITASVVDDGAGGEAIHLEESRYGSGVSFTVSGYGADLDGTYTGTDVSGTIDGVAATGSGRSLESTSGASDGLILQVTATPAEVAAAGGSLALGAVTYSAGIGGALDAVLDAAEGTDGSIQRARDLISGQIRSYDEDIEAFETRVELRATALRRKFANLESTMGRLQSEGQWLQGQLAGLF